MNTPTPSPTLLFPELFNAVDEQAAEHQRRFLALKATELTALAFGALVGILGSDDLWGAAGLLAVLCFLVAVFIRFSGSGQEAEKRWYDARAAAESVKALSWEYAVAGESFRLSDPDPESAFLERLRQILKALPSLNIPANSEAKAGVTESMQELRGASRDERYDRYKAERIEDQVSWYARKAERNKQLSRRWSRGVIAVEITAVCVGLLRIRGVIEVDLLGAFGALSAGMIAWIQAKSYTELSESYSVTSHEVGIVAQSVRSDVEEEVWAQSIHDAEAAFSREHTMWLARRQSNQHL